MTKTLIIILVSFFSINMFGQGKQEMLKINWPEEYKWKIGSNQENEKMQFIELVPGKEDINNWTILGNMMSLKNVQVKSTDQIVEMYRQSSLKDSPKAKLIVIESDEKEKNIWILFKIETPSFPNDPNPESQLFYAIQGNGTLYINFVAIKKNKISSDFIKKWSKVFKSSELVYQ
jgi:hypothetical protein